MSPLAERALAALRRAGRLFWADGEAAIWFWALLIGVAGGYAAAGFRLVVRLIQQLGFGVSDERLAAAAAAMPWERLMLVPVLGGVAVSLLLWLAWRLNALPEQRSRSVADVIEARALHSGRMPADAAGFSAVIAAVTLGAGASAGREGAVVHMGAAIGAGLGRKLKLSPRQVRTLLACGAAAAIAASFNAPIAGVLYALEVILGNYALRVIAPVSVASLAASVVANLHFGDTPAFAIPPLPPAQALDYPASAVLGALAALTAIVFINFSLGASKRVQAAAKRVNLPLWALPAIGGVLVGALGVMTPQILGVQYSAITHALEGRYTVAFLLVLVAMKLLATGLTLGFRFGGGVFSPTMVIGATLGAAFGGVLAATGLPTAGTAFFGMVGMGAVTGAVLGAPLSTTLIVFELTRSYEAGAAMLVAVSIATVIVQSGVCGSYYQKQVARRGGWQLTGGAQRLILQTVRVRDFMTPVSKNAPDTPPEGPELYEDDTLDRALALLKTEDLDGAAVLRRGGDEAVIGYVSRTDALLAYNKALIEAHIERA